MNKFTKMMGAILVGAMSSAMIVSTATAAPWAHKQPLPVDKVKADLAVMILGSGDPAANPGVLNAPWAKPTGRAGSSFLIFADGVPVLMMDTGAGSFKSLALSGASIADVKAFLYTHLHLDHTSDMSGMVKSYLFHSLAARGPQPDSLRPLNFYGPNNTEINPNINPAGAFDSMTTYVDGHYARPAGLERYLHGFANAFFSPGAPGAGTGATLETPSTNLPIDYQNVPTDLANLHLVTTLDNGLTVHSIAVKHGPDARFTPSVAYRITYKGKSIVWSGDTDSSGENMTVIGLGADVLIYDTAISENPTPGFLRAFHTTPTRLGEVAAATNPGQLVLAHLSGETESLVGEITATIRTQGYRGPIKEGKDLQVINVW